jgi:hypothetical protein
MESKQVHRLFPVHKSRSRKSRLAQLISLDV